MSQGELQNYLREQKQGDAAESGVFTVNPERAVEQVAGFVKLYHDWHLLKLVQAFVLAGATEIRCHIGRTSYNLEADLPADSKLLNISYIHSALQRAELGESALGHLVSALAGGVATKPKSVALSTPSGRLLYEGIWSLDESSSEKLRFEVDTGWSWWKSIANRGHLNGDLCRKCRYLPVPFYVDTVLQRKDWYQLTAIVAEHFKGGGCLGFVRPELEGYEEVEEDVFLYREGSPKRRYMGAVPACSIVWENREGQNFQQVISLTSDGEPRHQLVKHGVVIAYIALAKSLTNFKRLNFGVNAVTDCSHLKTDASGMQLIDDPEYRLLQRQLLEDAKHLTELYLKHLNLERTFKLRSAVLKLNPFVWLGKKLANTGSSVFSEKLNRGRLESLEFLLEEMNRESGI